MVVSKSNKKMMFYSALVLIFLFSYALLRDVSQPTTVSNAVKMIQANEVRKAVVTEDIIYLHTRQGTFRVPLPLLDITSIQNLLVDTKGRSTFAFYFMFIFVVLIVFGGIFYLYVKSDTPFSGFNKKELDVDDESSSSIVATSSNLLFRDVAGIDDVKEELLEIISFLKDPNKFAKFGVRMPRGLLLVGPPGVGKTMIAKAVAGEAGVPFYYQSASSFVQIYVGMGAKRVRELFAEAKKNAPSIVFIDEIDAVGKMRGASGRNDERDATLNQLLTEMDGFDSGAGVVVIAATNKIDVLDDALLRAGRFDRRIFVELPTLSEREAIVSKYIEKIPNNIDAKKVAQLSVGFNGASLATLINEAALKALRDDSILVNMTHIEAVKDKVKDGKKRLELFSQEQKEQQAHYQVAKAFVATQSEIAFERCTLSGDDILIHRSSQASKQDMIAELSVYLSGMAMMHTLYNEHFISVEKDLSEAKLVCRDMIERFGMGDDIIGNDDDVKRLLTQVFKELKQSLSENQEIIKVLALKLLEEEILLPSDFNTGK